MRQQANQEPLDSQGHGCLDGVVELPGGDELLLRPVGCHRVDGWLDESVAMLGREVSRSFEALCGLSVVRLVPAGVLDVRLGGCLADEWLLRFGTGGLVLIGEVLGVTPTQPRSRFALTAGEHGAPGPGARILLRRSPISWAPHAVV
jgi:hypothetical protein